MKKIYLYLPLLLLGATPLGAQVANDDCPAATPLPDQLNYCSGAAAFSTEGAAASFDPNGYPVCIDETNQIRDVWFSFVALRNSVSIQVTGAVSGNVRGSLQQPQFALYAGSCDGLTPVACRSPFNGGGRLENAGTLIFNELQRGDTYYVMIGGRNGNAGTFELCFDQFEAVADPSSDCSTGVVLCDKSPFAVQALQGSGQVRDDLLSSNINCREVPTEANSAWYKWTCDQPGSLNFVIDPLGAAPNEDIDFVLYEMTGGLDDCGNRTVLRQMFSGETGGNPPSENLPCLGETGLSDADPDVLENCGCDRGNNNFVSSIDMVAGRSYALVIMNFTSSGDGFAIEFGGEGTFRGPDPSLTTSSQSACVGETITFQDNSTSLDTIVAREWDFGPTATPRTAVGAGPHDVYFSAAGQPAVSLIITTSRNCKEFLSSSEIEVVCCDDRLTATATVTDEVCPSARDGRIDLTGSSLFPTGGLNYRWSSGETTASISGLLPGTYSVTLTDNSSCERVYSYEVSGPAPFVFDTLVSMPECNGGTDGALTFTILSGGAGGYEYSFNGGPFSPNNRLTDLSVSSVNVRARDANDCEVEQIIEVDELELVRVSGDSSFVEPTCSDGADGRIEIRIANGQPAYRYDFNQGAGLQSSPILDGLTAGDYRVDVVDAAGCRGSFAVRIPAPPLLEVDLQSAGSSCFGTDDGFIVAVPAGGRPGYTFDWTDGPTGPERDNLAPATYTVGLTDDNGCRVTSSVTLTEPGEIVGAIVGREDLQCFGDPTGAFTLGATGGSPDYLYSADGENFQPDPRLVGLPAGDYRLYVMDTNGCLDSLDGSLTQPVEFVIDAGEGGMLTLGQDTVLAAQSNYDPVTYQWGPDSLDCLDPQCTRVRAGPVRTTVYEVTAVNADGCRDTVDLRLLVVPDRPLYIPNAISPNGDGVNDSFTVYGGAAIEEVNTLRIYDRWGGLVYESPAPFFANEPGLGWDGTVNGAVVNPAVFVYYVEVRFINGTIDAYAGDVTVMR